MVMVVYFRSIDEGHIKEEVRAIAFSSFDRREYFSYSHFTIKTKSFISVMMEKNWAVLVILISAFTLLIMAISVPAFQHLFSFQFPASGLFPVTGATMILMIFESIKVLKI